MTDAIEVRESLPADIAAVESLYAGAFPDEDLLPLVRQLLAGGSDFLSLVAISGPTIVGHVCFSACGIVGSEEKLSLLGPLAVAPDWQRKGIGARLVREGLDRLKRGGVTQVQVLGDPAYYARFGFQPDDGVAPPYPLPAEWREAWQRIRLCNGERVQGTLLVPRAWRRPALWAE
jgi:putative acetyltransferase